MEAQHLGHSAGCGRTVDSDVDPDADAIVWHVTCEPADPRIERAAES